MKIFYAINNLRSLKETPRIELRPITILVGRNSAGKSTFLRSLALLRQSLEARSSAPILWYGDYVDFGDFMSAVNQRNKDNVITFEFTAEDFSIKSSEPEYSYYVEDYAYTYHPKRTRRYESVSLKISLCEQAGRTVRKQVELAILENRINLRATFAKDGRSADSFSVNGVDISEILPNHRVFFDSSNIFSRANLTSVARSEARLLRRVINKTTAFGAYLSNLLKDHVNKRILPENISVQARKILKHHSLNRSNLSQLAKDADSITFKRLYTDLSKVSHKDLLAKINAVCAMNYTFQALSDCEELFRNFFISTTYLGPARARSERYYRFQELEVSEIAPDGHNLPMFLGSLPSYQLSGFSEWIEHLFGFGVGIQRNDGHISIQIKREKLDVNVADTGYGVSQILPVLAQIWWSSKANRRRQRTAESKVALYPITMEQPELHLHPAHQAQLADAFLNALPDSRDNDEGSPVFIVETHSESLINRLGELIEQGRLSSEDVQIVIFSSSENDPNVTTLATSAFDTDGSLINWPYGFFSY